MEIWERGASIVVVEVEVEVEVGCVVPGKRGRCLWSGREGRGGDHGDHSFRSTRFREVECRNSDTSIKGGSNSFRPGI